MTKEREKGAKQTEALFVKDARTYMAEGNYTDAIVALHIAHAERRVARELKKDRELREYLAKKKPSRKRTASTKPKGGA